MSEEDETRSEESQTGDSSRATSAPAADGGEDFTGFSEDELPEELTEQNDDRLPEGSREEVEFTNGEGSQPRDDGASQPQNDDTNRPQSDESSQYTQAVGVTKQSSTMSLAALRKLRSEHHLSKRDVNRIYLAKCKVSVYTLVHMCQMITDPFNHWLFQDLGIAPNDLRESRLTAILNRNCNGTVFDMKDTGQFKLSIGSRSLCWLMMYRGVFIRKRSGWIVRSGHRWHHRYWLEIQNHIFGGKCTPRLRCRGHVTHVTYQQDGDGVRFTK